LSETFPAAGDDQYADGAITSGDVGGARVLMPSGSLKQATRQLQL